MRGKDLSTSSGHTTDNQAPRTMAGVFARPVGARALKKAICIASQWYPQYMPYQPSAELLGSLVQFSVSVSGFECRVSLDINVQHLWDPWPDALRRAVHFVYQIVMLYLLE